jgi:hypothetical protein
MLISRDEFLSAQALATEWVPVPELGQDKGVFVRVLSGSERDAWEAGLAELRKAGNKAHMQNFRARYVAVCACDDQGKPIFSDADVDALGAKSGVLLDRIFDAARKLNKMFPESAEAEAKN